MTTQVGYNKDTLLEMFRSREVTVKFRKANGEIRVLRGTLQENVIPEVHSSRTKRPDDGLVTVWDLDQQDWRSFHPYSVIEAI